MHDAGLEDIYQRAMSVSEEGFHRIGQESPLAAQYLLTHGHNCRVLSQMNLRECYHLFKLQLFPPGSRLHSGANHGGNAAGGGGRIRNSFRWLRLRTSGSISGVPGPSGRSEGQRCRRDAYRKGPRMSGGQRKLFPEVFADSFLARVTKKLSQNRPCTLNELGATALHHLGHPRSRGPEPSPVKDGRDYRDGF